MLGRNVHLFVQLLQKVVLHYLVVRDTHSMAQQFYPKIYNLEKCMHMCGKTLVQEGS